MEFLHAWVVPPEAHPGVAPWVYILSAFLATMMVAASKGGFGGGAGVLSVPLLLQVASLRFVIGMWLPVLVICDLITVQNYPKSWSWQVVRQLIPGLVVGVLLAHAVLWITAESSPTQMKQFESCLKLLIGVMSLAFLGLQFLRRGNPDTPWDPTWSISTPTGFLIGVTTTFAHAAGPVATMYMLPQKLEQRVFVGTMGWTFLVVNLVKVPLSVVSLVLSWHELKYALWMMVVSPLGVWLGVYLNRRVSQKSFLMVIRVFLAIAGTKLIYDGVRALMAA
jgi:uncharacterized protein